MNSRFVFKDSREITFTVPGKPVAKPRMTNSDRWNKRPVVMEYRAWADAALWEAKRAGYDPTEQQIDRVVVDAFVPMPASWPKSKKADHAGHPHQTKPGPDADNVLKSVCDALTDQDVCIWSKTIEKYWEDGDGPRVVITITVSPMLYRPDLVRLLLGTGKKTRGARKARR